MFNRVSSLILAVLLFFIAYGSTESLLVFVVGMIIFAGAVFVINYKRLGMIWPHLLLPWFYLLGSGSVFIVLTNNKLQLLFMLMVAVIFYLLQMNLGRESHFLQNIWLLSVFGIFVGLFGMQFYFHLSFLWLIILFLLITYMLIVQGFAGFSLPVKKYFHWLISLVMAETALGLSLWPTYYVVNALIAFMVFYLLWVFSFSAFFGKLTRNKIYWQLSLVIFVLAITLATASFKPLTR